MYDWSKLANMILFNQTLILKSSVRDVTPQAQNQKHQTDQICNWTYYEIDDKMINATENLCCTAGVKKKMRQNNNDTRLTSDGKPEFKNNSAHFSGLKISGFHEY